MDDTMLRVKETKDMNNLRLIRELYGITQEEIAVAINVNRATISVWENSEVKRASDATLEKLSLYYGIGPEYFYECQVDNPIRQMLVDNSKRQKEVEAKTDAYRNKAEEFRQMLSSTNFDEAIRQYMFAMKLFMTTLDEGSIEKLETALKINEKMGMRLRNQIEMRRREEDSEGETWLDLLEKLKLED